MKHSILVLVAFAILGSTNDLYSQAFNPVQGCVTAVDGNCLPNAILSAMPFLRIVPDARAGAMGDVGLATSADPNALHFNSSKLAFAEENSSFAATYTPWLRNLGLQDVYLTYLTGYKKVDDLATLGFGLRFFSLGEISFTDPEGNPQGEGKPRELEFAVSYNRKLSDNLAMGLTAKYIYSNLASGQQVGPLIVNSANAFAADISLTYKKKGNLAASGSETTFGMAITNLGSKVSYTGGANKDFLPANLGLGTAVLLNFDDYNSITFALDINKLLIPTPVSPTIWVDGQIEPNPDYDPDGDAVAEYKSTSSFGALISSFGDAQGGFSEELTEYNLSFGAEYWYSKQFAVRAGYYYENQNKGDRQFITVGAGLKYNVFNIDISYLVPTNNRRNPLDNTLRFGLIFDFAALASE